MPSLFNRLLDIINENQMIMNNDRLNDEHLNNLKRFVNSRIQKKSMFRGLAYTFRNHKMYRKISQSLRIVKNFQL